MKSGIIFLLAAFCLLPLHVGAETLDEYLSRFNLQERKGMKITARNWWNS